MMGTVANVAVGSGLKIAGVIAGKLIEGFFRNKEMNLQALAEKNDFKLKQQSGEDSADNWTKYTRRVLAWLFMGTVCFVIAWFAVHFRVEVDMLIDKEKGIFGWILGGSDQKTVTVTLAQMIMNIWPLAEIMFGFYFTKVGK